ncbi:hypothetical protein DP130_08810 [Clostridium tetani]|uniref:ParB/Sulfiredoxin domain-containing protein n=1 Tax=Clostridium tetani TaxID=1513 RepID=A0A4Q0VC21_CLOTA|nr:DUF6551 family protein [Clostridium tetani]RXI48181.1 hypothetical protein DP130_08810 [Clostridium tetani]
MKRKMGFEELEVSKLTIDPTVQGALQGKRVEKIINDFREEQVGILIVSKRENGQLVVLDGFHRSTALKRLGVEKVMCQVHEGLSLKEEAEKYLYLNKERKQPRAVDDYKVSLVAGDETILAIQTVLQQFEVKVDYGAFTSPKSIVNIYENFGVSILSLTLEIYIEAWGKANLQGKFMNELAKFINYNYDKVNVKKLKVSLKNHCFEKVKDDIDKLIAIKTARTKIQAFQQCLYQYYNQGEKKVSLRLLPPL